MNAFLIKGGRLLDPASDIDAVGDLLIASGRIVEVGAVSCVPADARIIHAAGCWVAPGLCDPHVHFRQPGYEHKETIATGSTAAVRGGYTAVICEPNTRPPIDSPAVLDEVEAIAARDSVARLYVKVCMTKGQRGEAPVDPAVFGGRQIVRGISDDGHPVLRRDVALEAFRLAARHGLTASPHCEDSERSIADCRRLPECEFAGREPFSNEDRFIRRDIECAQAAGARLHVSHVSTAAGLELIREAKGRGLPVTCEAAPHHLLLDSRYVHRGSAPLVNPPLRRPEDAEAVRRALEEGLIDVIATDHAPHSAEDKAAGARGLIGLECCLALIISRFVMTGVITPLRMIELMSCAPRRIFGIEPMGLAAGAPADVVIIDPAARWTIDSSRFASKSRNCPYDGWSVNGRAVITFVGGRIVWEA